MEKVINNMRTVLVFSSLLLLALLHVFAGSAEARMFPADVNAAVLGIVEEEAGLDHHQLDIVKSFLRPSGRVPLSPMPKPNRPNGKLSNDPSGAAMHPPAAVPDSSSLFAC
ncbi:hypothetical protein H6P81_000433 [Aristolochia fimbriata]|uniref:Uncharacterized protein n=1 Tax=Aristolochia fimbriata TaxID=158543 RepID=A0AAV7F425_ARIFI|nr:hypothetical protein H6P81_000433 [Aristolochia fimbriata]